MPGKIKIAVLVSGKGTNLQAIIKAEKKGKLAPAGVELVISDKPDAPALIRAKNAGIRTVVVEKTLGLPREEFDELIAKVIREGKIDLIVLAGYMRVLGKRFIGEFYGKIINIHPALLPSFKGVSGVSDAFEYGVKVTGITVHFVNEGVDEGPIIAQSVVEIAETDTQSSLEEKIHRKEHELYPEVIRLFAKGKLKIEGRKVKIDGKKRNPGIIKSKNLRRI